MIKVSVVVATYRRSKELKRALISIAEQTYKNIQIVLVDDNADEKWNKAVLLIVEEVRKLHANIDIIYVVNKTNQGSAETRNIGIRASAGEFITFLDDDDVYLPEKVELQLEFMINNNCDYSITDLDLYDVNDKLVSRRVRNYITDNSSEALAKYNLKYHMTGTDTMMFKSDYLEKIGYFPLINIGDEFYLMQNAIENTGKFGYLKGCHVKAYVHTGEGGLSSGDGKIAGENAIYEYKKQYFHKLDRQTVRYIKMRHYAVLAYAEMRRKRFFPFVRNTFRAFFAAPISFIKMIMFERK